MVSKLPAESASFDRLGIIGAIINSIDFLKVLRAK